MADPASTWEDLTNFGVQAQGATFRCNIDKAALSEYLTPEPEHKCRWYSIGCKEGK
jgi:hypothetical protein